MELMNHSPMPSMDLIMVTPFGNHSYSYRSSIDNNGDGIVHEENRCSRELLYDQLYNMIAQEEVAGYRCCDYLSYYSPQPEMPRAQRTIDVACRTSICGWMYRVADHFMIEREGTWWWWGWMFCAILCASVRAESSFVLLTLFIVNLSSRIQLFRSHYRTSIECYPQLIAPIDEHSSLSLLHHCISLSRYISRTWCER